VRALGWAGIHHRGRALHGRDRPIPGSRSRDAGLNPSPSDTPVPVRAALSGEANRDPDLGRHELEASPFVLGGSFLNQRPNTRCTRRRSQTDRGIGVACTLRIACAPVGYETDPGRFGLRRVYIWVWLHSVDENVAWLLRVLHDPQVRRSNLRSLGRSRGGWRV
jgi:hypothetical protein